MLLHRTNSAVCLQAPRQFSKPHRSREDAEPVYGWRQLTISGGLPRQ